MKGLTCQNCYHGNYRKNYYKRETVYGKHCKTCVRNSFDVTQDNFTKKAKMLDGKGVVKERK